MQHAGVDFLASSFTMRPPEKIQHSNPKFNYMTKRLESLTLGEKYSKPKDIKLKKQE